MTQEKDSFAPSIVCSTSVQQTPPSVFEITCDLPKLATDYCQYIHFISKSSTQTPYRLFRFSSFPTPVFAKWNIAINISLFPSHCITKQKQREKLLTEMEMERGEAFHGYQRFPKSNSGKPRNLCLFISFINSTISLLFPVCWFFLFSFLWSIQDF